MKNALSILILTLILVSCVPDEKAVILKKWNKGDVYIFQLSKYSYEWNYQVDSATFYLEWIGHDFNLTKYREKRGEKE